MAPQRHLTGDEITLLTQRGCSAENWEKVTVVESFKPEQILNTHFGGTVTIGDLSGTLKREDGPEKPCGIYNAVLIDCTVGDGCRIAAISGHIANYMIGSAVRIEGVGTMQTNPDAAFGNGVETEVLNEGGGREVILFNTLSSQFAYLMCLHRHRPELTRRLQEIARSEADKVRSSTGTVGDGALIRSAASIVDVAIGPAARINNPASLANGTILSAPEAVTDVGPGVSAENFIIAEGATVTSGAILKNSFAGQACTMGNGFSAENSLFFANSEAFHGEGCAVFCGPYTVTHHKSTLLIAGLFSFYNAGSGTNQSNHMYKLGPVHEGKLERGTKTGSFSYMMWPCRTGPFSVVMGKHTTAFDTSDYPFSHIEADPAGRSTIIPGLNITTVGTVRDGAKWPSRDRRFDALKRDRIIFDVFSPYLAAKMIRAQAHLKELQKATDKSIPELSLNGALIKRPILRTAQKYYRTGIDLFLLETLFEQAEKAAAAGGLEAVQKAFATETGGTYSERWVDIGGQLMPEARLASLHEAVENGEVQTSEAFLALTKRIEEHYSADSFAWAKQTYRERNSVDLAGAGGDAFIGIAESYEKVKGKFLRLVRADAEKEFDDQSSLGFGQDGDANARNADFEQVRGRYEENSFVNTMKQELDDLTRRVSDFKNRISPSS